MPDEIFANRRLAEVYDPLDPDRSDLEVYAAIVYEFGARTVLDIGCGTGTFACVLARRGIDVIGVDPAGASLEVARHKDGADRVRWMEGDATVLPPLQVDLATMTANVAQVFLTDEDWDATIRAAHAALRPGGRLIFETRDPARKAWLQWNPTESYVRVTATGAGDVESWEEVDDVSDELVSFRSYTRFVATDETVISHSTLRFRPRDAIERSLTAAGFVVDEVRDAPDRPGREFVFVGRRI